jgi:L-lactate dehydrogenase complex protein LldG
MSAFENIIGRIRQGLSNGGTPPVQHEVPETGDAAPVARPSELRAQFIAALSAVGGKPIEAANESAAIDEIAKLMRAAGARSAAVGEGITINSEAIAARLSSDGCRTMAIGRHTGLDGGLVQALSTMNTGIVEADYAIAPTGTLVMIAQPARPRSLSLLPPINVVLLRASRILPDLAAVLRTVGPATMASHPMVMVTGPSRTADIEKRIVIGVHGPKELYVVIMSDDSRAPLTAGLA